MREAVGVVDARGLMTTEESLLSVWIAAMVGAGMCAGAAAGSVVCGIAVAVCACACAVVWLRTVQDKRRDALREGIPDALRSMAVCFQAGLSLLQTFQQVASEVQGPLGTLFARAAHQLETGEGAGRALEVLRRGSSVAEGLESAAAEARAVHRAQVEERVAKAPVKMMVPTGTLILPAMLLLVLGPVLLELMEGM